jgi:PhnB protein
MQLPIQILHTLHFYIETIIVLPSNIGGHMSNKIPEGFHTITPGLVIEGATQAIDLYKKAFNAKEEQCLKTPDGKVMHACLKIGDSHLFLADVFPEMGCIPSVSGFYLYVADVDNAFKQARGAGLSETHPVQDMFWGDRTGTVKDPFGIQWTLATHVRDVSQDEIEKGRKEFLKKAA